MSTSQQAKAARRKARQDPRYIQQKRKVRKVLTTFKIKNGRR